MPRVDQRRTHLMQGKGFTLLLAGLTVALALAVAFSVGIGTVDVPVGRVVAVVWAHLTGGTEGLDPLTDQIVWTFRTPRVLLAAFVGSSLSLLVVFVMAQRGGRLIGTSLVLAGVAVAYLGMAGTGLLQLLIDPSELRGVMFWLLGSVAGASWSDLAIPAAATAVTGLWLASRGRMMNALATGEDTAAGLGVDVDRLRVLLLVAASLLTATVVSVAGGIGFVGLVVPHAVRLVVGPDHRKVIPVSLLGGAVFLVLVDLATRTVNKPNEMPIGIFTAALGAPFFLMLLRGRRRSLR
ncbi:iron ABC transporter permease [Amycolatopsis sp. BJA-103]|uniref:FecCD family ABC transporter permease n=1 Tax=Amycolatopsis sp. BJA-103 TaxID=1911175 RepID=UPI000C78B1EE|nr:iron ABC transporter permease [Amycolatopsis sp. BJA-103]AUI60185.1 ABC transporter permease [Amycolatopsis sp. BJA-103]PNE13606.1 ABC transporter permease [Amycolatopsis sp. BJA-103]